MGVDFISAGFVVCVAGELESTIGVIMVCFVFADGWDEAAIGCAHGAERSLFLAVEGSSSFFM